MGTNQRTGKQEHCVSEVNLRDGDNSETAETNQTTVREDLENICGTHVQQTK